MVAFSTILRLLAFFVVLTRLGPTAACLIRTLKPAFSVALAAIRLRERLIGLEAVGGMMVLSLVVLVNLPPLRLRRGLRGLTPGPKAITICDVFHM